MTRASEVGRPRGRRRAPAALALLLVLPLGGWPLPAAGADRATSADLAACIRDPTCHRTVVAAHRGFGTKAPANSRQAIAAAVAAGVPVIEVDVRQSGDGEWFLFHDAKLDGSTTGRGRIEDLPARTVEAVRLGNGEALPRLADIHALTQGRALLAIDVKAAPAAVEGVADWLAARGALDDALLFLNTHEEMMAAARARRRHPHLLLMVRLLDTRITVENTRYLMGGLPDVFHTERIGAEEVARLHALGVKVWMSAVALEKYLPPFRSFVLDRMLGARPDFVLSRDPVAMMRRLGGR